MTDYACPKCLTRLADNLFKGPGKAVTTCTACGSWVSSDYAIRLESYVPPPKPVACREPLKWVLFLLVLAIPPLLTAPYCFKPVDTKRDSWRSPARRLDLMLLRNNALTVNGDFSIHGVMTVSQSSFTVRGTK